MRINSSETFSNNMSGSMGRYGLGVDARWNTAWAVYGEFNYGKGSKQESPYSGHVGVRYSF
ncbi:autotransporter outer membrane beta-barrel domain-containing protein [Bordetella holmesii]|uniref:Outer membrane insertion signal domain protein n=2 Tax=Bordetella holmesii TaxID=35814 RepID=A0A158M7D1_9BORD|nr:outer membrane autotransporter barrel domain protein [Bordetella holmesii ATCC 51541]AIT24879.1 outer membrane autotransporter barrel domain protein [Bordetella holmesii 44057]AMD44154.1 hypothetical protein H558_00795 [Bordetella holmesii H558]AMD50727.1 hypothetical protein F783_017285 [Bordetella holmesii F627]AOB36264.1 autotransporter outer membrane beta-barrel domain-containing protein [Bordetella holmesii]EWM45451.1 outer membrane autotransporter barrel domain protein [Bordetella hol